jgi:hypothetical protein
VHRQIPFWTVTQALPSSGHPAIITAYCPIYNVRQLLGNKGIGGLRNGVIDPALIMMDHDLEEFLPGVKEFVKQRYQPTGIGLLWIRMPPEIPHNQC